MNHNKHAEMAWGGRRVYSQSVLLKRTALVAGTL
jgi:hypothetical protein